MLISLLLLPRDIGLLMQRSDSNTSYGVLIPCTVPPVPCAVRITTRPYHIFLSSVFTEKNSNPAFPAASGHNEAIALGQALRKG